MKLGKRISLKDFSNFRIGGFARDFVQAETVDSLIDSIKTAKQVGLPVFVLGGGTNILWSDDGFDGVVIQPAFKHISYDGNKVTAGAGFSMPHLVSSTVSRGLAGLEWAGGLPGSFGGAIYGNAGCFGGETKDVVEEVISLNMDTLEIERRERDECGFGYRNSIFKSNKNPEVIIQATLGLKPGNKIFLNNSVQEKIKYREARQPLEYPNIGSIFKNVPVEGLPKKLVDECRDVIKEDPFPVIPAAHLIDQAGMKGASVGGATVSTKHPNFIVNTKDAKASDVKELIKMIKEKVQDKYGIILKEEVLIIN